MQEFDPLTRGIGHLTPQACNVAAKPGQTCDQTIANRVVRHCNDNWD